MAILAVVNFKGYSDDCQIILGDKTGCCDAQVESDLFEVIQALPKNEHMIRSVIADRR